MLELSSFNFNLKVLKLTIEKLSESAIRKRKPPELEIGL
jgi:hypothetical protein